jgi:site-specific recombinase XerC
VVIYGQAITFYSRWLVAQGREPVLTELNRAAIREWLAQLADVNQPATVKTRYRGLFRFCGWLVDEEELPAHLMETLSPPQPKSHC